MSDSDIDLGNPQLDAHRANNNKKTAKANRQAAAQKAREALKAIYAPEKKEPEEQEHEHEVDVSMSQSNNASTAPFVMHSECDNSASDFEIDIGGAWFEDVTDEFEDTLPNADVRVYHARLYDKQNVEHMTFGLLILVISSNFVKILLTN